MGFRCGLVGLPNVGKSTLFNALLARRAAASENFPFCTIDPNVGYVPVPDPRIDVLAKLAKSETILPARMTFVDIAGLVRGASKGEGLGNRFLGHVREMDAIAFVVRCFEDDTVTHVAGRVDPLEDIATIETELMLADLQVLENCKQRLDRQIRAASSEAKASLERVERGCSALEEGVLLRDRNWSEAEDEEWRSLNLLTAKPTMYVANVDEASAASGNHMSALVGRHAEQQNAPCISIAMAFEAEVSEISDEVDRRAFLEEMGVKKTALDSLIQTGFSLLDLITFFTAGPKEARAWVIRKGWLAPQAAGVIHGDFEKGFIRAETIAFEDYLACGGEVNARESGKMRLEGRDYPVRDADVIHFRFSV